MNLTFSFDLAIGGVATDADSTPLLRDAGGTFGVRRTDTGVVVVGISPPASYSHGSGTGVYEYTLTGALPGVTYEFAYEVVINGVTYHGLDSKTMPAGVTAVGKYVTQLQLEAHYDADVIRLWSRKSPDATSTDVAAVQAAITTGEALVDSKLRKRYLLPLTGPSGTGPLSGTDAAILLGIARPIVAAELFFSRPQQQGTDEAISLKSDRKAALAELDLYTTGAQYLESPQVDRTPTAPGVA